VLTMFCQDTIFYDRTSTSIGKMCSALYITLVGVIPVVAFIVVRSAYSIAGSARTYGFLVSKVYLVRAFMISRYPLSIMPFPYRW
jgi:hypothetical protein